MYLLDTKTYELRCDLQPTFAQEGYAILSHRWVGQEITFDQLKSKISGLRASNAPARTPPIDKIRGAAQTARHLGLKWIWIDSCCIDRANAVEQTESINSMFKWYRDAKVCIIYLNDVQKQEPQRFHSSEREGPSIWFSRGWTRNFSHHGTCAHYLMGVRHFGTACIAAKMSWMAGRTTTRVEDLAYSMLGIFNINMTTQYGEGMRAFMRLHQTLLSTSRDESLFAWRMPAPDAGTRFIRGTDQDITWESGEWGLLAPSPDWFKGSARVTTESPPNIERPLKGFEIAQAGIVAQIPSVGTRVSDHLLMILGVATIAGVCIAGQVVSGLHRSRCKKDFEYPLRCWLQNEAGRQTLVRIYLRPVSTGYKRLRSCEFGRCNVTEGLRTFKRTKKGIIFQPVSGYLD
ncbi:HET-domain-containing protein [Xylaria sp. FL1777]|nr:HET-domain-containing protein [Xylaria sp. FL1777]